VPGKDTKDTVVPGSAREPAESFEDGEVGFARAVVIETLAARDPEAIGGEAAQERLDDRGLADPRLAGDEHDLAGATHRPLQPRTETTELVLAPDQGRVGRYRRLVSWRDSSSSNEAVPAAVNRPDELWGLGRVAERFADLAHTHGESGIADRHLGPDRFEELLLGDQAARPLGQVPKDGEGLGTQANLPAVVPDGFCGEVQTERTELQSLAP
jgi:hypothetical protein